MLSCLPHTFKLAICTLDFSFVRLSCPFNLCHMHHSAKSGWFMPGSVLERILSEHENEHSCLNASNSFFSNVIMVSLGAYFLLPWEKLQDTGYSCHNQNRLFTNILVIWECRLIIFSISLKKILCNAVKVPAFSYNCLLGQVWDLPLGVFGIGGHFWDVQSVVTVLSYWEYHRNISLRHFSHPHT